MLVDKGCMDKSPMWNFSIDHNLVIINVTYFYGAITAEEEFSPAASTVAVEVINCNFCFIHLI